MEEWKINHLKRKSQISRYLGSEGFLHVITVALSIQFSANCETLMEQHSIVDWGVFLQTLSDNIVRERDSLNLPNRLMKVCK